MTMMLLKEAVEQYERDEIINTLEETNWVMARAARKLGITDRMIGYKIKKYGIKRLDKKQENGNNIDSMQSRGKQV